ncbi:MAG: Gfo/Idh/MocA family oxidoreductase, partial [Verrucomicrobia bacterium]|nr:Gfo/Idh/MocA family oxidoreductase [Verrucomicrobiota bacterium]
MNSTLRIGLIGCGAIAQFAHLPALARARHVRLTAICDGADDLLQAVGRRMGVSHLYTDHRKFLEDAPIDAVILAVPDPFHVPLAVDAFKAGKHVLVEKPLGANSAECLELLRIVRQTNLKLQVGSMKRHDPGVAFARQFIQEKVGPILSVSGVFRDTIFR